MKRELIIEMAQKAGFELPWSIKDQEKLERFANLVAAFECEACAQIVDDAWDGITILGDKIVTTSTAIRARIV